jgi:hypothetical protein
VRQAFRARPLGRGRYRVRAILRSPGRWSWAVVVERRTLLRGTLLVRQPQPRLILPYSLVLRGGRAYIGEGGARAVYRLDLATRRLSVVARGLGEITGIDADAAGNVYAADFTRNRVLRIDRTGRVTTLASVDRPADVAIDRAGNVYVATLGNFVYRIDAAGGMPTRIAGTGAEVDSGDGGPAIDASVQSPHGIDLDEAGNVYVPGRDRIRRIDAVTGRIDTVVAGIEAFKLNVQPGETIYFLSGDPSGGRVHRFSGGVVETVVGNGTLSPRGDGGQATAAGLLPSDVALAPDGALLVLQTEPFAAVRRVDPQTGAISTFVS